MTFDYLRESIGFGSRVTPCAAEREMARELAADELSAEANGMPSLHPLHPTTEDPS